MTVQRTMGLKQLIVSSNDEKDGRARLAYRQVHVMPTSFLDRDALSRLSGQAYEHAPVFEPGEINNNAVSFKELTGMNPCPADISRLVAAALAPCNVYAEGLPRYHEAMWKKFDYLTCQGATFHNDTARHWNRCLFWVIVLEAREVELVMPDVDLRLPLQPGQAIVFDPHLVHGVCRPTDGGRMLKKHFKGARSTQTFLSGELELSDSDWQAIGCPWMDLASEEFAGAFDLRFADVTPRSGSLKEKPRSY